MPLSLVADVIDEAETAAFPAQAAGEADHRIANNLMIIAGLIRNQAASLPAGPTLPTDDVRGWLREMSVRIAAVGRLHDLLAHGNGKAVVDLAAYLRDVADAAMSALTRAESTEISFDLASHCEIPAKQGAVIGLLVAEAMTNAFKYSHPTGVPGKLGISSRSNGAGGFVIEVADDGIGLPAGFDPKTCTGNGVDLMRALADQLGGRLAFDQGPIGLCVRLEVPAPA